MKYSVIVSSFLSLVLLSSCSTYSHSVTVAGLEIDAYTDDVYATLSVDKGNKIEGEIKATFLFNFIQIGGGNDYAEIQTVNATSGLPGIFGHRGTKFKSLALGEATKDTDYDVVVYPRYSTHITTKLFGLVKTYEVKVVGYGAKINELDAVMPTKGYYGCPLPLTRDNPQLPSLPVSGHMDQPAASTSASVTDRASEPVAESSPVSQVSGTTESASDAQMAGDPITEIVEKANARIAELGQKLKSAGASQDLLEEIQALRRWWKNSGVANHQEISASLTSLELQCKSKINKK